MKGAKILTVPGTQSPDSRIYFGNQNQFSILNGKF
jgi:hypothetical protein